jgi:6-phosphogluconolactonase
MKFWSLGRVALASCCAASCLPLLSCSNGHTVGYLYATSAYSATIGGSGNVYSYNVNSATGQLQVISNSLVSAEQLPIAEVASPNQANVYVVNQNNATVQTFGINQGNGLITPLPTDVGTSGTYPTAIAIDQAGKYVFVTDTYANGFGATNPGPGDLDVFAIGNLGTLGTPASCGVGFPISNIIPNSVGCYYPTGFAPMGVTVLANEGNVYVTNQGSSSITGYTLNANGGLTNPTTTPAGSEPSAVVSDPHSAYVYATDYVLDEVLGFSVGAGGVLTPASWTSVPTDKGPLGITIDPRDLFMYVSNYNAADISAYMLTAGKPSPIASGTPGGTYAAGAQPLCLTIDPVLGEYLYVANYADPSVGAYTINVSTGQLAPVKHQPFLVGSQATCVAVAGHGTVSLAGSQ